MGECELCGQDEDWHKANKPAHAFVPKGEAGAAKLNAKKENQPKQVLRGVGGDPALRLALIRAGVISYEQLMLAEEELRGARDSGRPIILATDQADGSGVPVDSGGVR